MSFKIEYKINQQQLSFDTMELQFEWFQPHWDEEQILMEIMEYVYTNIPSGTQDYDLNCSLKNMQYYINTVKKHFKKEEQLDKEYN